MRVVVLALVASVSLALGAPAPRTLPGWSAYDRYCAACHGTLGDGRGPAAPFSTGTPRDFMRGVYEWRSTAIGDPPSDSDLRTAIRFGVTATSMPAFDQILSDTDIDRLVAIVKAFAPATFAGKPGKPVTVTAPRTIDAARGAQLWTQQGCDKCHGAGGRGGDLARVPVRRPHAPEADKRAVVALSIATGRTGMPGYAGALSDADIYALADHVVAINANAVVDRSRVTASNDTIEIGTWPGSDPDEARIFGRELAPQGPPPASLAPAQASLSSQQCARCHAKQAREWSTSVHARASTWGLTAREADHAVAEGSSCNRCHTPLAEQATPGPLRDEGVTCAGCHVRGWTRHGPPVVAPTLLALPAYPLVELPIYERSDLCMACHQLPPRTAVDGKPLLNTYKEWLESPYMPRGVQCQHCHMPNREHTWLGIHDRDTVRQGIQLDTDAHRSGDVVTVSATVTNIGAGHYLPTTATPQLVLRIQLLDEAGAPIAGTLAERTIGRDVVYANGWTQRSDTRLAPGASISLARGFRAGRTAQATTARVTVEVHPDAYYEQLYAERLAATKLPAYETALARARASHYVVEQRLVRVIR